MEDNNSGAQPPPAPQSRMSPISPIDQNRKSPSSSLRRSPLTRSTSNSSDTGLPPLRPQLPRIGSARFIGSRDRANSSSARSRGGSIHSQGGVEGGMMGRNSSIYPPARTHMRVTSDANLLLASLDKKNHVMEDEAESTLLDILERKQVSFVVPAASSRTPHRRNRSVYHDALLGGGLGSFTSSRPSSAPSSREADGQPTPLPRPGLLPSRSISSASGARSNSQRNLLSRPPPTLTASRRAVTDSWAFDEHGQLLQPFSEDINPTVSEDSSTERVSPQQTTRAARRIPSRGHYRGASAQLPTLSSLYERGVSDSSQSSGPIGLTTPGERSRFVALTMKSRAAENMEDPGMTQNVIGEGDLPDLMHALEAHRDNESTCSAHRSRSSGRGSVGRGSHLGSASRGSRGRMSKSATHSAEKSKGGSLGSGYRSTRPFSGVFSSPFANDHLTSNVEQMFQMAEHMQELAQIDELEEEEGEPVATDTELTKQDNDFLRNLLGSHPVIPPAISEESENKETTEGDDVLADEHTPLQVDQNFQRMAKPRPSPRRMGVSDHLWSITSPIPGSRFYRFLSWWADLRRQMKMFAVAFNPSYVKGKMWNFFQHEVTLYIIPALAVSAFFFYRMNNPIFAALPTDASISWWILFILRHYVTLQVIESEDCIIAYLSNALTKPCNLLHIQLAYVCEYFFVGK